MTSMNIKEAQGEPNFQATEKVEKRTQLMTTMKSIATSITQGTGNNNKVFMKTAT